MWPLPGTLPDILTANDLEESFADFVIESNYYDCFPSMNLRYPDSYGFRRAGIDKLPIRNEYQ